MLNKTIYETETNSKSLNAFPDKFFFFNNSNAGLNCDSETLQHKNISIVKGFTIGMWIRAEMISPDPSNKKIIDSSVLFSITSSKSVNFEVFLKNKSVYYRVVNENKEDLHHLLDIEVNQWTMLVFTHKPWSFLQKSDLTVWKNTHETFAVKNVDYPNMKNSKLMSVTFFRDFTGQVSNVFMLNEAMTNSQLVKDLSNLKFGIYSEKQIRIFKDIYNAKNDSVYDSFIFLYSPCRVRNNNTSSSVNSIKDVLDTIDGEISTYSEGNVLVGGVALINTKNVTSFINGGDFGDVNSNSNEGLSIFLPIFEFFKKSFFNSTEVLCEALDMILTVISRTKAAKNHTKKHQIINTNMSSLNTNLGLNISQSHFFISLGLFLENYNRSLFQRTTMHKFLKMVDLVSETQHAKHFFKWVLFNPRIFTKFDIDVQIELWKSINEKYIKSITSFNQFYDAKEIFETIIKVYDNDIYIYCCEEHLKMLCENSSKKYTKPNNQNNHNILSNPPLMHKISHLVNLIEHILTSSKIIAVDQLKNLVVYLAYEISPCLQKSLLLIIQKIIISTTLGEATRSKYITAFIKAKGLEHLLFLASISTLDVRLESLKIFEMLTKMSENTTKRNNSVNNALNINIEEELIPFLVYSVFPLKTPIRESGSRRGDYSLHHSIKNSLKFTLMNDHFNRDARIGNYILQNKQSDKKNRLLKNDKNVKIISNISSENKDLVFGTEEEKLLPDIINLGNDYIYAPEVYNKASDKSTLIKDLDNLNKLKFLDTDYKLRKGETEERTRTKDKQYESKFFSPSPLDSNASLNSLDSIEDDYWRLMLQYKIVSKFNVPNLYIREYSNRLNDFYIVALYDWAMNWLKGSEEIPNKNVANERTDPNLEKESFPLNRQDTNFSNSSPEKRESKTKTECSECILFHPALNIIMKLVMHANIVNKQKCLVDLLLLTGYNRRNCQLILENRYFYQWLLDLIFPFCMLQETLNDNKQSGLASTIVELGIKIHTNVMINSVTGSKIKKSSIFREEEKVELPFDFLLTWYYKVRKIGTAESRVASKLLRTLFSHLINEFKTKLKLTNTNGKYPIWQSFINLTTHVYEFAVFSNFDKKIAEKSLNFDMLEKSEIFAEIIQNLNYDFEGENFTHQNANHINIGNSTNLTINNFAPGFVTTPHKQIINQHTTDNQFNNVAESIIGFPDDNTNHNKDNSKSNNVSMMDIWVDRSLLIQLYDCYKIIWDETVFKLDKKSSSSLSDEFKFIENLVNKLIFENKPNHFYEDLRLLLHRNNSENLSNLGQTRDSNSASNNLMRVILNIIFIFIRLSESKNEVFYWVKELEKYTLFIISATENSKLDSKLSIKETNLNYSSESAARTIILVFNFLHDELNSPRRREFSDELVDVFKSTIRFLFIYFTHIVERINQIKEAKETKQSSILVSALVNIKNAIMFRIADLSWHFSPCWKVYNDYLLDKTKNRIFSISDIREYKLNKYVEIPERFNTETWIYAFGENNTCYKIIKDGFNLSQMEKVIISRFIHSDSISFNSDICSKEKSFVNKVIKSVSSAVKDSLVSLEKKFKLDIYEYVLNKITVKEKWKNQKKKMFQLRGEWTHLDKFIKMEKEKKIKFKVANHLTSSITRPILFPIYDMKDYLPIFSKYDSNNELFIAQDDNKTIPSSNNLVKINLLDDENEFILNNMNHLNSNKILPLVDKIDMNTGYTGLVQPLKVNTNKSVLFYTNPDYSDFVEKYSDIEKLVEYYSLVIENKKINTRTLLQHLRISISEIFLENISKQSLFSASACYVKLKGHNKGKITVTNSEVFFVKTEEVVNEFTFNMDKELIKQEIESVSSNAKLPKCAESLFPSKGKFLITINLNEIKQIYKRRYFYKKTSVEIFTFNNKSYFLNFETFNDRESFCKVIYDLQSSSAKINPYLFDYHLDIRRNPLVLNRLIEEWVNWRITNLDLLMNLNNLAGRSFNDLTQYPVFPWIISDYTSENPFKSSNKNTSRVVEGAFPLYLRDLTKPMGVLGSQERLEMFQTTFKECSSQENNLTDEGKYFYSSHYSNPFYVTNFLARLFPFAACAIELQGGSFDNPQRQFLSIGNAFSNSLSQSTDVRELIPEFFYLPECLLNINKFNFGKIEGEFVNNVELPPWCNDPYRFVIANRLQIESEDVSYKINEWVDLIFGYKQKGKEGENAMNIFWKSTYEDGIDIENIQKTNTDEFLSYMSKIYMGQTPSQILIKPAIQRINKSLTNRGKMFIDNRKGLRVYNSTSEIKNGFSFKGRKDIKNKMIVRIKALQNDRLVVVYNNMTVQVMKVDDTPYSLSKFIFIKEKECQFETNNKRISDEDESIMKEINHNQPIRILLNGKIVVKGGYYDGKFLVFNIKSEESYYVHCEDDFRVTVIETDENEEMLFVGTSGGKIYVYEIVEECKESSTKFNELLKERNVLCNHDGSVNYIYICNRLNVMASVANDKTCNLYTYPNLKQFKVIKAENFSYDYVFLSACPLPSIILYSKANLCFYCYSINGALIHSEIDGVKYIFTPCVISDATGKDHLVYGTQYGDLYVRPLPLLTGSWKIELTKSYTQGEKSQNSQTKLPALPVKCFDFSKDRRSLFFWQLEDFNISVIRDPKDSKKKKSNNTLDKSNEENKAKQNFSSPDVNAPFETK